jgi:hypothetical protein
LVAVGYATSRSLNPSVVEYDITQLGSVALALKQYGILDAEFSVEPTQSDIDGLWRIKIKSEGAPAQVMDVGGATKLAIVLRNLHADDIANDFDREIARAQRYSGH